LAIFLLISTLFIACSPDFEPNNSYPDLEDDISYIFYDTIAQMPANIKLEFVNDECRSISATYGEDNEIYFQIIYAESISTKKCLKDSILPKFKEFEKIKKHKYGFDIYAENDNITAFAWRKKDFVFYLRSTNEYLEQACDYNYFLKEK
jgi:hypothetical protein